MTRSLVQLILWAAVLTAPMFLFAEEFSSRSLARVALSNGVCAALCVCLLTLLRVGRTRLAAQLLVYGLTVLVASLASTNGEPIHVNVINFVLVTVLAASLLGRTGLLTVATLSAAIMVGVAWAHPSPKAGEELIEARLESIVQFLPTYLVVVGVLWLRGDRASQQ